MFNNITDFSDFSDVISKIVMPSMSIGFIIGFIMFATIWAIMSTISIMK